MLQEILLIISGIQLGKLNMASEPPVRPASHYSYITLSNNIGV